MKQVFKFFTLSVAFALLVPTALLAQNEVKGEKGDKGSKDKKEVQQIIITNKGEKNEKLVIEINGDNVTVNGKSIDNYKEGSISIQLNKLKDWDALARPRRITGSTWNFNENDGFSFFNDNENHAMLGVTTEETETGVKVNDITKESAAEKIGLKPGDIITKVDDKKITSPDDLSKAIREHKPGDKVTVTYIRDKKTETKSAELTKWKGVTAFGLTAPGQEYKMNMDAMGSMPKVLGSPRIATPYGLNWSWSGGSPKLGLSVQDTDDGKGVKVIEVDEESNAAKAGIKNEDIITEVDGKAVNGTDAMVKVIKESKDKNSVMVKLLRKGKPQSIEVKMPKKIKTADL